jgi:hypothetical protein
VSDLMARPVCPAVPAPRAADDWHEQVLGDLGPKVFVSLARSDQRCKAMQYVRALLAQAVDLDIENTGVFVAALRLSERLIQLGGKDRAVRQLGKRIVVGQE